MVVIGLYIGQIFSIRYDTIRLDVISDILDEQLIERFGCNWPIGSGEEDENVKSLQTVGITDRRTDGRTDRRTDKQSDDGRQVIRKAHLSFQLR